MQRFALSSLVAVAAIASLPAQDRHVFRIDTSQSTFTFSGTASLPGVGSLPIVGQPSNTFALTGTQDMDLTKSSGNVTGARFVTGGAAGTTPDLMGVVNNPIPFLPPLATVNVTGLSLTFLTNSTFAVGPLGNFNAQIYATVLGGTATVTALGNTSNIPLAGQQSSPQSVNGSITPTANGYALNVSVTTSFMFTDPSSGATGNLTVSGSAIATYQPLASDTSTISLASGGMQNLFLSTGGASLGQSYLVLGSASGTSPGLMLSGGITLPLNADGFLVTTATGANAPPFVNTFGVLSPLGKAQAAIALPPGLPAALAGLSLDFAYIAIDGSMQASFASNAVPLQLVP